MKHYCLFILSTIFLLILQACVKTPEIAVDETPAEAENHLEVSGQYRKYKKSIEPFFEVLGEPEAFEWRATNPENGQTFEEYIKGNPTLPTESRNKIYIQPIGSFDKKQNRVIELTGKYMESFYGLPVELLQTEKFDEPLSLENYRIHPQWKIKQIRTGFIIDEILKSKLPNDAAALIAFTNEDLFPDQNFNFVFGQASFENRVGVWSLYRLDDDADEKNFLERTLKVAVHETGHMFSMAHCTKYKCVMNGSNGLFEIDTQPIDACPECMAKIVWMRKTDPENRYKNLAEFCKKAGLSDNEKLFAKKSQAISAEK